MTSFTSQLVLRKMLYHQVMLSSLIPLIVIGFTIHSVPGSAPLGQHLFIVTTGIAIFLTLVSFRLRKRLFHPDIFETALLRLDPTERAKWAAGKIGNASLLSAIPTDLTGILATLHYLLTHNRNQAYSLLVFWVVQYGFTTAAFYQTGRLVTNRLRTSRGSQ